MILSQNHVSNSQLKLSGAPPTPNLTMSKKTTVVWVYLEIELFTNIHKAAQSSKYKVFAHGLMS